MDVALVDRDGGLLARARIGDDAAGLARLLELLAENGGSAESRIPVAIETPRGLLTACLRASRPVYAVNPMAVARYRDRHSVAGRKPDHGDAVVLANILRTDLHAHRPLPADSELARAVAVLARAQQDAVWDRVTAHNKLRSHLREYYPGFLAAFAGAKGGITRPEARTILAAAPAAADADAAKLTLAQLRALRTVGRGARRRGGLYWMRVLPEIRNRGVRDVCMLVCDGLKGLPGAVSAVWEKTIVQACIVHLLRNSFKYASKGDWAQVAKDLKPVCTAASEAEALDLFAEFGGKWEKRYPAIIRLRENAWAEFVPFLRSGREIRTVICTTNAIVILSLN